MAGSHNAETLRRWLRLENLEDRTTPTAVAVDTTAFATDRVLVTMADGADVNTAVGKLAASRYAAGVERLGFNIYQVNLPAGVSLASALPALDAIRGIAATEVDYAVNVSRTPNDASYPNMWGLNNTGQGGGTADADIDAAEAWDTGTGSSTGKIVGVIDTGVDYTHPDLAANMWRNAGEVAGDGVDNDANGLVDDVFGADYANNDGDPMDDNNHGTHVAGTIGAVGNNGVGVTGVAWNTRIMALKFLTASGSGSTSNAIKCIDYAVAKGASILNNSWGGGGFSSSLQSAITRAKDAGVIFVAAAGNSAVNTDVTANYPSNYNVANVVSVAATDRNDNLASFSNYGATTVDLAAPGVSILSTLRNNTYGSYSGTSMATPHVAGAIAVFWDQNPGLSYSQVISRLLGSVDQKASLAGKTVTGGRLNLKSLMDTGSVSPPPVPPAPPPPAPPAGTVQYSGTAYSVGEAGGVATISVTRTGGSAGALTAQYNTSNGTATAGSDYTATSGTLTWADGDTGTKTFTVPIINDTLVEGNETLNLALASATLGSPATAVLTITDNDVAPPPPAGTLQFGAATYSVGEAGVQATVSVTRVGGSAGAVTAQYATSNGTATAGADYTATSGTLTWADGETATKTFTVPITDDTLVESNETINLTLTSANLGAQGTAVLTITDNDVAPPPDTTGARVTSAVFSGLTANSFNKVRVTFNEAIAAGTFTAADVSVSGGAVVSQVVQVNATQFDVLFTTNVTTPGTHTVTVGPDVRDAAGNQMDQNQNGTNGENPADRFSVSTTLQYPPRQTFGLSNLAVPINDLSTSTVQIVVPPGSAVDGLTVSDLNVGVTLEHTYTADLVITLTAPNGTTITLFSRRGGSGDNLTGTLFNDEATTAISAGRAPFTGSFRPEQLLSAFDGINPVGTWTLKVQDVSRRDVGMIRAVSLGIATDPGESMNGFSLGGEEQPGSGGVVSVGAGFAPAAPQLTVPQQATTPASGFVVTPPAAAPANSPSVAPAFAGFGGFQPLTLNWEGLAPRNADPVFNEV